MSSCVLVMAVRVLLLLLQSTINEWAYNATLTDGACPGGPPRPVAAPFPTAAFDQNTFYAAVGYLLGL